MTDNLEQEVQRPHNSDPGRPHKIGAVRATQQPAACGTAISREAGSPQAVPPAVAPSGAIGRRSGPAVKRYIRAIAAATWQESSRQLVQRRLAGPVPTRDLSDVAIVAALTKRNGICRGAQLQHEALVGAGRRTQLLDATAALRNPFFHVTHRPASAYVFHTGVPETCFLLRGVLPEAARAWRVGYWAWELPEPPPAYRRFVGLMSEIWVPSHFVAASLRKVADCPIRVVPHQVENRPQRTRVPGSPLVALVLADSRSSFDRKNPAAAVAAFRLAFGDAPVARLVVKLNGNTSETRDMAASLSGLPNVRVITDFLDERGLNALYRSADVLLSLHRAEGFGLPMLEAMTHGVPVIGTGWSGNMDFMTETNSLLVPFKMVPVRDGAGIYTGGAWAEPDVAVAAQMLQQLADDPILYAQLAQAAYDSAAAWRLVVPG